MSSTDWKMTGKFPVESEELMCGYYKQFCLFQNANDVVFCGFIQSCVVCDMNLESINFFTILEQFPAQNAIQIKKRLRVKLNQTTYANTTKNML